MFVQEEVLTCHFLCETSVKSDSREENFYKVYKSLTGTMLIYHLPVTATLYHSRSIIREPAGNIIQWFCPALGCSRLKSGFVLEFIPT